jgi:hypothetical protein
VASILCQWTAHPARSRPRELALVIAIVAVTAAGVLATFEDAFLAVLAAAVLVVAVWPFLVATRYIVTEEGIEEQRGFTRRARRFADLRRVEVGRHAALVSPFARRSFLDRRRGLLLLLDGADRDRVIGILRDKIRAPEAKQ